MLVRTSEIQPSQNYLKPSTVNFIRKCLRSGNLAELPPAPLVRKGSGNGYIAIDGHNLLAVMDYLNEPVEVHVATSPEDGLPATSKGNLDRNQDLRQKYETCLQEVVRVQAQGIASFADLVQNHVELFEEHQ